RRPSTSSCSTCWRTWSNHIWRRARATVRPRRPHRQNAGGSAEVGMAEATGLLERDLELGALSGSLASARGGGGPIALVVCEAGIGKTALLTQFARLHARDARLFWGACDPLSTPRPLAPLLDIAWTQGGSHLAGRIAAGASREAIFQALFEEL